MIIFDPTSEKKRRIKNPTIVFYRQTDKFGKERDVKGVKFTVIGNNRFWDYWLPYNDFKDFNPHIDMNSIPKSQIEEEKEKDKDKTKENK